MENTDNIVQLMLEQYAAITKQPDGLPEWAVHKNTQPDEIVRPTIPFIGKDYAAQSAKILVYASAENLRDYYLSSGYWAGNWLDIDEQATNRHRRCFDDPGLQKGFFPHVHIGPMNDGCLATAVFYLANKIRAFDCPTSPREFYETIAFGNYGKFSIETETQRSMRLEHAKAGAKKNIDYSGNLSLMDASHEYVKADLLTLQPDYIIMPKTAYRADKEFIDAHKGTAKVIGIYQMNATNINCHIRKKYYTEDTQSVPNCVQCWYDNLIANNKSIEKYYPAVFAYLDEVYERNIH